MPATADKMATKTNPESNLDNWQQWNSGCCSCLLYVEHAMMPAQRANT